MFGKLIPLKTNCTIITWQLDKIYALTLVHTQRSTKPHRMMSTKSFSTNNERCVMTVAKSSKNQLDFVMFASATLNSIHFFSVIAFIITTDDSTSKTRNDTHFFRFKKLKIAKIFYTKHFFLNTFLQNILNLANKFDFHPQSALPQGKQSSSVALSKNKCHLTWKKY